MTTTLLAVDDSKTMRRVLEITFAGESEYRLVTANTVADAMAKVASEKPTIVLADAGIGAESGYDLCRKIKGASPGTMVVILSSKQAPYDNAKGSAAGADDHMDKPFDTQQMIDRVVGLARKGPAVVVPAAPVHAPVAAAPAPAARAASVRSPTLSYGTPSPAPSPSPSPVAFAAPPASAAPPTAPAPRANTLPGTPAVAPVVQMAAPPVAARAPVVAAVAAVAAVAPSAALAAGNGDLAAKLGGLGLSQAQIEGVLAISREVIEQVVWEVVPVLAETMIQEEIRRLTS